MSLYKKSLQTSINPHITYEVTSSLKIPNWHELAMHQYLLLTQQTPQSLHSPHNKILPLYKYLKIYNHTKTIDFSDQHAVISLTRCILKVVFDINWTLPLQNLCPRVPNRVNYLVWIERYVIRGMVVLDGREEEKENKEKEQQEEEEIVAVDVGTGASLIYPLIGNKMFGWKFIATQIDQQSILHAQSLITINNLQLYIHLLKPSTLNSLLFPCLPITQPITFVMCNPPFFDTSQLQRDPLSTMTCAQHNIEGGEYQFFFTLYVQSFHLPQVKVFTMMIGLGRNFEEIKKFLLQEYEEYGVLEHVRFGKINQAENARFIVAWKVKKGKGVRQRDV